jgi:hypothetical protein
LRNRDIEYWTQISAGFGGDLCYAMPAAGILATVIGIAVPVPARKAPGLVDAGNGLVFCSGKKRIKNIPHQ